MKQSTEPEEDTAAQSPFESIDFLKMIHSICADAHVLVMCLAKKVNMYRVSYSCASFVWIKPMPYTTPFPLRDATSYLF